MKSMTFGEFFAMPPGTIFGQATGLPHQFSEGLYRLDRTFPEDDESCRMVTASVLLLNDYWEPRDGEETTNIIEYSIEDDHRFLVYEAADIDRLAGLIGRGPVAHGEDAS